MVSFQSPEDSRHNLPSTVRGSTTALHGEEEEDPQAQGFLLILTEESDMIPSAPRRHHRHHHQFQHQHQQQKGNGARTYMSLM